MRSFRIGSAFGIPIRLSLSFLLVFPVIAYLLGAQIAPTVDLLNLVFEANIDGAALDGVVLPWVLGAVAALGLFVGVILHELGHSLVARWYDVEIESITLWLLGGVARFVDLPDDWHEEFFISLAGPVVSVVLGASLYVTFFAIPEGLPGVQYVVGYLAILNVVLAGFNMLPGFPLDGGRIFRALLSSSFSRVRATEIAATVGKGFALLLGLAGLLLGNFFWLAIAFFVYVGATSEARQAILESALQGITVADVMTPVDHLRTATPDETVDALVERMVDQHHTGYPVVENGELVGIVTLEDTHDVAPEAYATVTVRDVMTRDLVSVTAEMPASEAITTMQRENVGRLPVTDGEGRLRGLVSRTDLLTVFEVVKESRALRAPGTDAAS